MQCTKGFTKETLRKQQNDVKITKNINQNVRPIIYVTEKLQTEKSAIFLFTKYFTKKIWLQHSQSLFRNLFWTRLPQEQRPVVEELVELPVRRAYGAIGVYNFKVNVI